MNLLRRQFLHLAAGAAALPALSRMSWAQTYPSRPVRLLIGFSAGGGADIVGRLIGQWLQERLGQPVVIENRPGAGTNVATEALVRAPADGYTLGLIGLPNAINATLYDKLSFNFIRDVTPIAGILRTPEIMVVNLSVPAKTLSEFIAHAKVNPGKINMGSAGNGSVSHVAGELFMFKAGLRMVHVPYRGAAPALTDLLGGQVQVVFGAVAATMHQYRKGACAGGHRHRALRTVARHPNRGRIGPGLRGERLVRHRGAQRHARRDCQSAQHGDE
jgi:tripartite-type tricarboxylate transporter receptor subunit TctC